MGYRKKDRNKQNNETKIISSTIRWNNLVPERKGKVRVRNEGQRGCLYMLKDRIDSQWWLADF